MNNFDKLYTIIFLIVILLIIKNFWYVENFDSECLQINKLPSKILCGQRISSTICSQEIKDTKCYERAGIYELCNDGNNRCRDYLGTLEKGECVDTIMN